MLLAVSMEMRQHIDREPPTPSPPIPSLRSNCQALEHAQWMTHSLPQALSCCEKENRCLGHGVSILSASYLLEKNTDSGGDATRFRDQSTNVYRICACYKSTNKPISRLMI